VYGRGSESEPISIDYKEFEKLYAQAGTSSLVDLVVPGSKEPSKVIISDIQRDPLSDRVIHVDLHRVRMDEKIRTEVNLEFVGEAPAVKEFGGNLIISADSLEIECLPKDLISSIKVDLSKLKKLDDSVHISDLDIPAGITIIGDKEGSVVSVLAPREEKAEISETPETVVIGEEKKEETAAEGAEPVAKE
jgi:large subunit ribosomal protein L25